MLEYNFNKYDNDFITLWSKYILTHDYNVIKEELEKLAELGQINAVQKWYLFNGVGANKKIDAIVDSYTGATFNEQWAIANKQKQSDITAFTADMKMLKNFISAKNKMSKWDVIVNPVDSKRYDKIVDKIYYYKTKVSGYKALEDLEKAASMAKTGAKELNNYLLLEAYNEIVTQYLKEFPYSNDRNMILLELKANNAKIINNLLKTYKTQASLSPEHRPQDIPTICFTLAKAIASSKCNAKNKAIANSILRVFADREYSKSLLAYSCTRGREIIK